jgi:molybdopterin-guanine dinucleotide biosynthesis protein A
MRTAGIVLCGGRSSRMGRSKAWLPWRGRPLLVHVVETLCRAVDEVVVVSSAELELPPLDARVVCDRESHLGPLAGIREGLANIEAELAFVTGTDAPFLTPVFAKTLLALGRAAAPRANGFVQTMSAVYPRSALPRAEELIAQGRRRPLDLLRASDYCEVPSHELPDTASLRGFNTPAEYLAAVREAFPGSEARLEFEGSARRRTGREAIEVPVGTLAEVLSRARPEPPLHRGELVAPAFLVSLDEREFVRDTRIPIGPGERAVVTDARSEGESA